MKNVIVIGGGPAGMIAAGIAAENGANVTLLEKNEKLGKKLYITGKGRCNVTNNTDTQGLLSQTISNPRFMQSAYNVFGAQSLMAHIESHGTPLKTERGNRVFPVSDKSEDITKALTTHMRRHKVKIQLNCEVKEIFSQLLPSSNFTVVTPTKTYHAHSVIIATGGLSYPSTGSTGDGYRFAKNLGHSVTATLPSIVPITVAEPWVSSLSGLSLRNVRLTAICDSTKGSSAKGSLYQEMGEMLFTPTGVTGPLVLRASTFMTEKLSALENAPDTAEICGTQAKLRLEIDLKPALSHEQLDARILRDFADSQNKDFANALDGLLPKRLIAIIIELSQISPNTKVNAITRKERRNLAAIIKATPLTPIKTTGYREAVITMGGVSVKEINPSTMMSKKLPQLFFAGEVLDVDAMTGGYNLQIAFSTGYLAGINAANPSESSRSLGV